MTLEGGEHINQVDVKRYYETFLERYQKKVDTEYHASASLLEVYQGLPAAVDAYMMSNGATVGLLKLNSSENKAEVFSGDYEQLKGELRNRNFDYMLPIYPSHPTSEEEIDATVKYMIETRLREIHFSQYLKDVVLGIVNIEGQITEISKTNPWLSKQFGELTSMLSSTRKRAEDVSRLSDESRERQRYETYEELVGFLQEWDQSTSPADLAVVDLEKVRTFLTEFIRSYRATIDAKSLAKEAYPPFYDEYPYHVEFMLLPNKNVAVFFTKATEGMKFVDRQVGFTEFENEVKDKKFAFALGLPNCVPFNKQGAVHHAQVQAQIDLERDDMTMALGEIPQALGDIEAQIIKIKKSNPWLEQNLAELLKTLETCRKPVKKLSNRLDKQAKSGVILRSYLNTFDSSISIFPTSGTVPAAVPTDLAPPVYEDVPSAQVTAGRESFGTAPSAVAPPPAESYPVTPPGGEYDLQIPMMVDDESQMTAPGMEGSAAGTSSGDLNEIRSMLYTFERKLADFEKRLHYIDKYTEMIQRQQNKKFKAQKDLLTLESRKGRWLGVGIGVSALAVAVVLLLANLDALADLFGRLF